MATAAAAPTQVHETTERPRMGMERVRILNQEVNVDRIISNLAECSPGLAQFACV